MTVGGEEDLSYGRYRGVPGEPVARAGISVGSVFGPHFYAVAASLV